MEKRSKCADGESVWEDIAADYAPTVTTVHRRGDG